MQYKDYDAKGNILSYSKKNNLENSYIWGYNNAYQIAEIKAASISNVAFTSFEEDGTGNWAFSGTKDAIAFTGKKSYILSATSPIIKTGLDVSKTFIVSYWSKTTSATVNGATVATGISRNGWTYYEHTLPASTTGINITGTVTIDELRLFPKGALMTTFTYEPLIGMSSQCDANNIVTYYEYDGFNRLKLIRDQDNNIIKKYCYNYQGQQETCGMIANEVKTGIYSPVCPAGSVLAGPPVVYTVPAGTHYANTLAAANLLAQNDVTANGQAYANANGICCPLSFNWAAGITSTYANISLSGSTVTFSLGLTFPTGVTSFSAGIIAGSCCYPTATRTVPVAIGSSILNVIISTTGNVTVQLVSGSMPTGMNGFNGKYDLNVTTYYSAAKSGPFTRDCGVGQIGSTVTYSVKPYRYTSTVSQTVADGLASTDVSTNGQAYANTNGTCAAAINITGSNSNTTMGFAVTFTNGTYSKSFFIAAGSSNVSLGAIPAGTYTVQFRPAYAPVTANFSIGSFSMYSVTSANFTNISITATTLARVF